MQINKTTLVLASSLIFAPLSGALAEGNGFYAGVGFGATDSDTSAGDIQSALYAAGFPNTTSVDDGDTGFKIFAGYQINLYLGVEGGYLDLGEISADSKVSGGNPGAIHASTDTDGFFLGVKAGYPVSEALAVYAKLGLLMWDAEGESTANLASGSASARKDDDGTDFGFGLGLSYRFTDRFSGRVDWDRYQLGSDMGTDIDLFSVALQVHF